jgi:hypothetical protein
MLKEQEKVLTNFHKITKHVTEQLAEAIHNPEEDAFVKTVAKFDKASQMLSRLKTAIKDMCDMERDLFQKTKEAMPKERDLSLTTTDLQILLSTCRTFGFIREGCEAEVDRIIKEFNEDGMVTPYCYSPPPPDWYENPEKYEEEEPFNYDEWEIKALIEEEEKEKRLARIKAWKDDLAELERREEEEKIARGEIPAQPTPEELYGERPWIKNDYEEDEDDDRKANDNSGDT